MVIVAATLCVMFACLVGATRASAYSCSYVMPVSENSRTASVSALLLKSCSDGKVHVRGTLYDISCDSRSARLRSEWFYGGALLNSSKDYVTAGSGCGSSVYFDRVRPKSDLNGPFKKARICVWAQNAFGSSSGDCGTYQPS
ncbi:MAG: hypothetical protein V7607_2620 [Solirubrobacteraceae bacterium]